MNGILINRISLKKNPKNNIFDIIGLFKYENMKIFRYLK